MFCMTFALFDYSKCKGLFLGLNFPGKSLSYLLISCYLHRKTLLISYSAYRRQSSRMLLIQFHSVRLCRNWMRFKLWRSQQRALQQDDDSTTGTQTSTGIAVEEELGEVSDGELCVVCLMRRRRSAFISCGHLVCCQPCALAVEREASPKCPVCRQTIRGSVRIYDS